MADYEPSREYHEYHSRQDGGHTSTIKYAVDVWDVGRSVELSICDTCHYIEAMCCHDKSSWNEDETELTCDFCGKDGT